MSSNDEFDFGAEYAAFGDDLKGVAYEGEYEMLIKGCKAGTSAKGKQMFTITLAFQGGPLGAKGKTVDDRLYWSPENETAAKIFSNALRVCGASQEWIMSERPKPQQIADRITGNVVAVRLKQEEFNGQPQTRVTYQKLVKANGPAGPVGKAAQAQAVSLDDVETDAAVHGTEADATAAEAKEPATVGAGASGDSTGADPWAD